MLRLAMTQLRCPASDEVEPLSFSPTSKKTRKSGRGGAALMSSGYSQAPAGCSAVFCSATNEPEKEKTRLKSPNHASQFGWYEPDKLAARTTTATLAETRDGQTNDKSRMLEPPLASGSATFTPRAPRRSKQTATTRTTSSCSPT